MFFILMIIVITIIGLKYINSEHLDEKNEKFLWYYDINSSYHLSPSEKDTTKTSKNVIVAVIDSGIDINNEIISEWCYVKI